MTSWDFMNAISFPPGCHPHTPSTIKHLFFHSHFILICKLTCRVLSRYILIYFYKDTPSPRNNRQSGILYTLHLANSSAKMRWTTIFSAVTLLTVTHASPTPFSREATSSSWSPSAFLRKQTTDAVDSVKLVLEGIDRWTHTRKEETNHKEGGKSHDVQAWNVHTHEALPGISLRIKPTEGLCDKNVKQVGRASCM